jgi:hypothetical protein
MDTRQFRREVLDCLRLEGGQATWKRFTVEEFQEIKRMEADGLIEKVETRLNFTYRLKPDS